MAKMDFESAHAKATKLIQDLRLSEVDRSALRYEITGALITAYYDGHQDGFDMYKRVISEKEATIDGTR